MLYESYKNKIERLAKIRDFIIKYRAIFITILAIILAGVIALLSYIGSFTSPLSCSNNVVYGNSVQCTQEAFLSNVTYEYKVNDTWQTEKPIYPGEYLVRGVSKNGFGIKRYSEETAFTIIPKNVDLFVKNQQTTYGDKPTLYGNLINGDKVEGGTFEYIDKVTNVKTPITLLDGTLTFKNTSGEDITGAYNYVLKDTEILVTKRPLQITANSSNKEYNGTQLTCDSYTITSGSLVYNDTLNVVTKGFITNVGTAQNEIENYTVQNNNEDITSYYDITTKKGTLTVTKRIVNVSINQSHSASNYVYNATNYVVDNLSNSGLITVNGENGFLENDNLILFTKGENVGDYYQNNLEYSVVNNSEDKTYNYQVNIDGALNILPKTIDIQDSLTFEIVNNGILLLSDITPSPIISKDYDGKKLLVKAQTSKLVNGQYLYFETNSADANIYDINNLKWCILDSNNNVINSNNYTFNGLENVSFTINKKSITLNKTNFEKTYDREEWVYNYQNEGLVYAESLTLRCDKVNSGVYSISNITYSVNNGEKSVDNYDITNLNEVTLTIKNRDLVIKPKNATKIYDGEVLTCSEYEIVSGSLIVGDTISITTNGQVLNVSQGEIINEIIEKHIENNGNNVYDNYNLTCESGTLKILPRKIYISKNISKVYDREILEKTLNFEDFSTENTGHNLINNNTITFKTNGTNAGIYNKDNFSYLVNGTEQENYEIVNLNNYYLEIKKRKITLKGAGATKEYDSIALTNKNVIVGGEDGLLYYQNEYDKVVAVMTDSSTITNVGNGNGVINTIESYKIYYGNDIETTANYEVEKLEGERLYITPRNVTIDLNDSDKISVYSNNYFTLRLTSEYGIPNLVNGEYIDFTTNGVNVNLYACSENSINYVVNSNDYFNANYNILNLHSFEMQITPKTLNISKDSVDFIYDATNKTYAFDSSNIGLVSENHVLFLTTNDNIVKNYDISCYTYTINNNETLTNNYKLNENEDFTLKILPRPVYIETILSKTYDRKILSQTLTSNDFNENETGYNLVNSHTVTINTLSVNAGEYSNKNSSLLYEIIINNENEIISNENYTFVNEDTYKVNIKARGITLSVVYKEKIYDGTKLTSNEIEIGGDGLISGDVITYQTIGEVTNVYEGEVLNEIDTTIGSIKITYNNDIIDYVNDGNSYNYSVVSITNSTLKILPRPITILDNDNTETPLSICYYKEYDKNVFNYTFKDDDYVEEIEGETYKPVLGHKLNIVTCKADINNYSVYNAEYDSIYYYINYFKFNVENDDILTQNYEITNIENIVMLIKPFEITLTAGSMESEYNGKTLKYDNVTYDRILEGDVIEAQVVNNDLPLNVLDGLVQNIVDKNSVKIYDNGVLLDNLRNYNFTYVSGTLKVLPRKVNFKNTNFTTEYNGELFKKEFSYNDFENSNLVNYVEEDYYEKVIIETNNNIVGTYINENEDFTLNIFDNYDNSIDRENYNFENISNLILEITKRSISLGEIYSEKVFDGGNYTYVISNNEKLVLGHKLYVQNNDYIANTYSLTYENIYILNSESISVKENYNITFTSITLKITPKNVELYTISAKKNYDGTPLTCSKWYIEDNGVNYGEYDSILSKFTFTFNDITNVKDSGEKILYNSYSATYNGRDVSNCYTITYNEEDMGTLTIIPRNVKINVAVSKEYDDKGLGTTGENYLCDNLYNGNFLVDLSILSGENEGLILPDSISSIKGLNIIGNSDAKYVDGSPYYFTAINNVVEFSNGDITNYNVIINSFELTVTKRQIEITFNVENTIFNGEKYNFKNTDFNVDRLIAGHVLNITTNDYHAKNYTSNDIEFDVYNSNVSVTSNYHFKFNSLDFKILKRDLIVSFENLSNKTTYNGEIYTLSSNSNLIVDNLLVDDELIIQTSDYIAGTYESNGDEFGLEYVINSYRINGSYFSDYNVLNSDNLSVTIDKKLITITAQSKEIIYDGLSHNFNNYELTPINDNLCNYDKISLCEILNEFKNANEEGYENTIGEVEIIRKEDSRDVSDSYNVMKVSGKVIILRKEATLNFTISKTYDRISFIETYYNELTSEYTKDEFNLDGAVSGEKLSIMPNVLIEGISLKNLTYREENPNLLTVYYNGILIEDYSNIELTINGETSNNYKVKFYGQLIIYPIRIHVQHFEAKSVYTGGEQEFNIDNYDYTEDTLLEGDTFNINKTIEVDHSWGSGPTETDVNNYIISLTTSEGDFFPTAPLYYEFYGKIIIEIVPAEVTLTINKSTFEGEFTVMSDNIQKKKPEYANKTITFYDITTNTFDDVVNITLETTQIKSQNYIVNIEWI